MQLRPRPASLISLFPFAALALLILSAFSVPAQAQGLGTVVGTITDASGAVIPNAEVRITSEATGTSRPAASNAQGYYVLPSLQPSSYKLTVTSPGFTLYEQKGITLQADQHLTLNVTLGVEQAN